MSLRAFHIVFITVCGLLCAWLLGWGMLNRGESANALPMAALGAGGGAALALYLRNFLKKSGHTAAALLAFLSTAIPVDATACTTCFGAPGSSSSRAFTFGFAFLALVTFATLGGIVWMMVRAAMRQDGTSDETLRAELKMIARGGR